MFKLDLEKTEEPEIKLPTSVGSSKMQKSSRKSYAFALLIVPKPLTVWITTNWKILKEMGIPDHLTCLLKYLYAGKEATVRTEHGTTEWFQIGKGVCQDYILHTAYLTYMQSTSCRIPGWMKLESILNINNLRYTGDTTLMAEREEEPKRLMIEMKEESENVGLNLNIQKIKIMASGLIHFLENRWENNGNSERLYFFGLQNHYRW